MAVEQVAIKEIDFLNNIIPTKFGIALESNSLVFVKRRSCIRNFFSWFIHLITFTLVPRNASLDKAALHVLNIISQELKRPSGFTKSQKREIKNAIKNLYTIIKNEGGKETHKIKQLLISIDKIKVLDAVKKIESSPIMKNDPPVKKGEPERQDPPEVVQKVENNISAPTIEEQKKEPVDKPKDIKLQNLLQDLIDKKATKDKINQEIANLLLSVEDSVDLSPEQGDIFCSGMNRLNPQWLEQNFKNLHPHLIRFITKTNLEYLYDKLVSRLWEVLMTGPIRRESLTAFVHGFTPFNQLLPQFQYMHSLALLKNNLTTQNIAILEKYLSEPDVQHFIESFFGSIALKIKFERHADFMSALNLADHLAPKNRKTLLEVLSHTEQIPFLVEVLRKSKVEDNIIKTILERPPENEDQFFVAFVQECLKHANELPEILQKMAEYVFKNEGIHRQEILYFNISSELLLPYLGDIPFSIKEALKKKIRPQKILDFVQDFIANQNPDQKRDNVLKEIAAFFETPYMGIYLEKNLKAFSALLPFLNGEKQKIILEHMLSEITFRNNRGIYEELIQEAEKLPLNFWTEASSALTQHEHLMSLPPKQCAAIINGQSKKNHYTDSLILHYFEKDVVDNQKVFIEHLDPEFFDLFKTRVIEPTIWQQFLKVFDETLDQEETQKLLILVAKNLFKNPDCYTFRNLSSLKAHHMKLLSLEDYRPEIALPLALLTQKYKEPEHQRIITDIVQKLR